MLKKKIVCLVLVLCAALILTSCGQQQEAYPNQPREAGTAEQQVYEQEDLYAGVDEAPVQQQIDFNDGSYDPGSEEGGQAEQVIAVQNVVTAAPLMQSEYAGATPVKIDPIDKPTPTPLPTLTFSYANYTAPNLHLAFEGPASWIEDNTAADYYSLTNPDPSMDYEAKIEIRTVAVGNDYSQKELAKEVKAQADAVRSSGNFKSFDPSNTAARYFINGNGVYLAYTGTQNNEDETGVAGRIIVNTVNKTLYILHVSYPRGLANTFSENVYNKVRHSMKLTD